MKHPFYMKWKRCLKQTEKYGQSEDHGKYCICSSAKARNLWKAPCEGGWLEPEYGICHWVPVNSRTSSLTNSESYVDIDEGPANSSIRQKNMHFSHMGHLVSVITILLCHYSTKQSLTRQNERKHSCVLIDLDYKTCHCAKFGSRTTVYQVLDEITTSVIFWFYINWRLCTIIPILSNQDWYPALTHRLLNNSQSGYSQGYNRH